jgi:hypothetical protein
MKDPGERSATRATCIAGALLLVCTAAGVTQEVQSQEAQALAVAHAALAAITVEDPVGLTDLMMEGAVMVAMSANGGPPRVSTRAQARERPMTPDFMERGWDGRVEVSGTLATVWLPYDFYIDGEWSHCGVDLFTMIRTDGEWLIASLTYTVEQPPNCEAHPEGPPRR